MRQRAPQYYLRHRRRSQNPAQNPELGFPSPTLANEPFQDDGNRGSIWARIFPASPCGMRCFLDNFRQTFHNFQTGPELLPWLFVLRRIALPATGRRRRAGNIFCGFGRLLGPTVRLWSKKVAVAWLYSSLGNQSEIKRLFLESKLFPWIFTARSTLYLVLLSASTSLSCRSMTRAVLLALFKMAFISNFASN